MAANGEVALAMAFTQDVEAALAQGYPLGYSFPEEGTGFEVNAAAAVANAPEEQAKGAVAFLDWILTEKARLPWARRSRADRTRLQEPGGQDRPLEREDD
jgi:iron(III) transport system substrate-binding protein